MTDEPPPQADPIPAFDRLRRALGAFTLAMLGLSWPLWVESTDFPRVPWVAGLDGLGVAGSWALFVATLTAIGGATLAARRWCRPLTGLSVGLLAAMILLDQHRLQPWAYQYLLVGLALATAPPGRALGLARLFVIGLYVHSGLSKLDTTFVHELGRSFLAAGVRPFGLDPAGWPASLRTAAILAMPGWELAVGAGLCFRRTRRLALVGAILQHAALLLILGPLGLGHSTIVLVWNTALIAEDLILFGPAASTSAESERPRAGEWLARAAMVAAVILPFGERWGWWDAWPSFALYASHVGRTEVLIPEDDLSSLPPSIRRHVRRGPGSLWGWLDLTGWSREVRGVPVYPQARACHGLAEALAARYPGPRPWRLIHRGPADRWTGRREAVEAVGLPAIRRLGDSFRINAHPARRRG